MADSVAEKQCVSRRRFFHRLRHGSVVCGHDGEFFDASPAEAQTQEMADDRARKLSGQFIMDTHTHFLRDNTKLTNFARMRESVGKSGWNEAIGDKPQTVDDLKFANFTKTPALRLYREAGVTACWSRPRRLDKRARDANMRDWSLCRDRSNSTV